MHEGCYTILKKIGSAEVTRNKQKQAELKNYVYLISTVYISIGTY